MTDLFSSTSSFDTPGKAGSEIDKELQEFLVMQNQKAQLNARVKFFADHNPTFLPNFVYLRKFHNYLSGS